MYEIHSIQQKKVLPIKILVKLEVREHIVRNNINSVDEVSQRVGVIPVLVPISNTIRFHGSQNQPCNKDDLHYYLFHCVYVYMNKQMKK